MTRATPIAIKPTPAPRLDVLDPRWVVSLTPTTRIVLAVIVDEAHKQGAGTRARLNSSTIARRGGVSTNSVRASVAKLATMGLIEAKREAHAFAFRVLITN